MISALASGEHGDGPVT